MPGPSDRRAVLIGCGFFADNHLHAWRGLDGIELAAVCDLDASKAEAAARRFGVARHYTDAAEMIATEAPDLVDVVTTAPSHRELVELACRSARVVVCQKPFAERLEDAEAMVRVAEGSGSRLLVHENFRWQRPFVELAERLRDGAVGKVRYARISFRHGFDVYANQPYLRTVERLAVMDVGLHLFDLARHLLGDVERIGCVTQRRSPAVAGEDAFTALLTHADGAVSVIDCSFDTTLVPEPFPETIATIEGDTGTLELGRGYVLTLHRDGALESLPVDAAVPPWGARPWHVVQDSVVRFQRHALDVLHERADPQPSGAHNLETLRLAMAAYEAAERGVTVALPR